MDALPYIPGLKPADPGPLSRFIPPLEEGVIASWLTDHVPPGSWLLDPFGFAPRLALEAARSGYRLLVTANNPITRFLLEMAAEPPPVHEFKAALADLAVTKKGGERLEAHLQSLYQTTCEQCERVIEAEAFLWRKEADEPYARIYTCPHCGDNGEKLVTPADGERVRQIAAIDGLHRARALERVAPLRDEDRAYAEEALKHYLPRPLYVLTTLINRLESLSLSDVRRRALTGLILIACDAGNTLWDHPTGRPRPKLLNIPAQFLEHNLWLSLEHGLEMWADAARAVACVAWPGKLPESGGICVYDGRLSRLAHELRKEIPIAAVIASLPRPNQAFWTLSALWAGWIWGREAVEPFKIALRRRRYDWAWSATALHATFTHLSGLLPLSTPVFGLMAEPEPPFLTSALSAGFAAGFDLKGLAMRTEHDPIQIVWERGEHLKRELHPPDREIVRTAIRDHLVARGEPASYLHLHAAGLIALAEARALKQKEQDFDEAMRRSQALIEAALSAEAGFEHYSSGEAVETGLWGLRRGTLYRAQSEPGSPAPPDSLADRVEAAVAAYLQDNQSCITLELEEELYPRLPGLLTPSKGLVHAVLDSYAQKDGSAWNLRPEDVARVRAQSLAVIIDTLETIGKRLEYSIRKEGPFVIWEEKKAVACTFYVMTSALIGHALTEIPYHADQTLIVLPGGRAALAAYKTKRDPDLAERLKPYRLVKYRLLRLIAALPILTRATFEEQLTSDPIDQAQRQLMMF